MPLYSSRPNASPGVRPVPDKNYPTPKGDTGDPMTKPDFLEDAEQFLIETQKELSQLLADRYRSKYGRGANDVPTPYDKKDQTISGMERDMEYDMRRQKLEEQEGELVNIINEYKYVASLGDAPAVEDISGDDTEREPDSDDVGLR